MKERTAKKLRKWGQIAAFTLYVAGGVSLAGAGIYHKLNIEETPADRLELKLSKLEYEMNKNPPILFEECSEPAKEYTDMLQKVAGLLHKVHKEEKTKYERLKQQPEIKVADKKNEEHNNLASVSFILGGILYFPSILGATLWGGRKRKRES